MHDEPDVQATPPRVALAALAGLGVAWMLQRAPFHRSASVRPVPVFPTAVQAVADEHATSFSAPPPSEFGVAWMRQARPFHRSPRVSEVRRWLLVFPTATQTDGAVQATLLR